MAPPARPREPSIERTAEYEQFIRELSAFHAKRGTHLEPEPRVGSKHVDLYRLFKAVVERGGYDVVSAEKLAWRKLGQDFNLGTTALAALAFSLKTAYYKNLAAFEIATVHGKEPPPREILEDITARGAGILTRTMENFRPHGNRDQTQAMNREEAEGSGAEEQRTPREDRGDADDAGTGGRMARGLRQAPPQRVLFQPDLSSSRQPRQPAASVSPSQVATAPSQNNLNLPFLVANYEPKPPVPSNMRPVITPGNNPTLFRERMRAMREAMEGRQGSFGAGSKGVIQPGSGFEGPNIYVRTLHGLRSGIPQEQNYALHHLVKISFQQGEKYKFEGFPGLAEALIDKALEVGSLFFDVNWRVSYDEAEFSTDSQCLDGFDGTPDILQRIKACKRLEAPLSLITEDFSFRLSKVNEACLVLRNMVMLEENAEYLSRCPPIRDFLSIALNLPPTSLTSELEHHALDIAEQLTRYFEMDSEDPLFVSLLAQLESQDRGKLITGLRALNRVSTQLEQSNRLVGVPALVIQRICNWTLLDDEDLVHACLEFLYQYTAFLDNVEAMVENVHVNGLISRLAQLLLHGAKTVETKVVNQPLAQEPKQPKAQQMLEMPQELLEQLLQFKELDRSAHWLQCLFEEDPDCEITQIELWDAYRVQFTSHGHPLPTAADFIKNVTTTFPLATAQVTHPTDPSTSAPKFIIKGIRPRKAPKDLQGRSYQACLWRLSGNAHCNAFLPDSGAVYEHILRTHLQASKKEDGKWQLGSPSDRHYMCHWGRCRSREPASLFEVGMHIKTHLQGQTQTEVGQRGGQDLPDSSDTRYPAQTWYLTAVDDRGEPAGLPRGAALVLRNIARQSLKLETPEGRDNWTEKLFLPIEKQLWVVAAHNTYLATYVSDLLQLVKWGRSRPMVR